MNKILPRLNSERKFTSYHIKRHLEDKTLIMIGIRHMKQKRPLAYEILVSAMISLLNKYYIPSYMGIQIPSHSMPCLILELE